jgi:hypothetical protein
LQSRALIGATLAYGVAVGVAGSTSGTLPAAAETGDQVVTWFREHADAVRWSVWGLTISTPPFAVMVAMLRRLLPEPHRDVFLIGALLVAGSTAVFSWFFGGLALHAATMDPANARALLDVAVFYGPVVTSGTTTMMAPVTLLALGGRAGLPRWLGALGAVAFVEQAVETVTIFGSTGFTQPGGTMNMQLGASLTLAWILAFGIWGGVRGRAQPTS